MLTKLSTFHQTMSGDPTCRLFAQGSSIRRLAGDYVPEVQDWLGTYKSDQEHVAVLVNALGGSEFWGQNRNGDNYYWPALQHYCGVEQAFNAGSSIPSHLHPIDSYTNKTIPPYGYSTFLRGHPFVHHRNKDPNRAFGKVILSCLNHKMKRVELVVLINRADALRHGAATFLDRLDKGEYPDVSMGCRTPYDICTICGHKSRTPQDYCVHVKQLGMNHILPDGRQVGVINPYPNFFDISFVFVGADRTAKMMAKFASAIPKSILDAQEVYGFDQPPHQEEKPLAGTIKWQGMTINIERPKGTWRTGKTWATKMKAHYGEFAGTRGVDGDPIDVYVGDNLASKKVFVVHQNFTRGKDEGLYDEDKVMIGFDTIEEAKKTYLDHYDKPDFLRSITEIELSKFKKIVEQCSGMKLAYNKINGIDEKRHVSKTKTASSLNSYFSNYGDARKRQKTWRSGNNSITVVGSGINKTAAINKVGLDKILSSDGVIGLITKILGRSEKLLPSSVCHCNNPADFSNLMSTCTGMHIPLQPSEFQYGYLTSSGHTNLANHLRDSCQIFSPSSTCLPCGTLSFDAYSSAFQERLLPFLENRSYMRPVLTRRIICISTSPAVSKENEIFVNSPLLAKTASAYAWYQRQLAGMAMKISEQAIKKEPELAQAVFDLDETDIFKKEASKSELAALSTAVATVPLVLLMSASARNRIEQGDDVGYLKTLLAENPQLAALGTAALTRVVMEDKLINKAVQDIVAQIAVGALS